MVMPAFGPRPLKPAPQLAPASVMYGRFVQAMVLPFELVELWYAQYCVPNPLELFPVAVAMTNWAFALLSLKCTEAFAASAASCDCVGCDGAAEPLSAKRPPKAAFVLWARPVPPPLQKIVPLPTPWQYWSTLLNHELPPTPFYK